MKTVKTLGEWREWLTFDERLILRKKGHKDPEEKLSANEAIDMIIEGKGVIESGYWLRSLILRVYGIELE